ncbi:hypothetical protein F2Q70_00039761 [Brassica cretica]|uniref:Uncharacterized protein n=1 Tax=Brassica cretica TaxID=69181 RepID=A0A8S9K2Y2_BRACR|nr:hypothetical protein F2Q70_00039761 [Brassica cretica]
MEKMCKATYDFWFGVDVQSSPGISVSSKDPFETAGAVKSSTMLQKKSPRGLGTSEVGLEYEMIDQSRLDTRHHDQGQRHMV